jgi:hypothetical protein
VVLSQDPLETQQIEFQDPFLAAQVAKELHWRGGSDVHLLGPDHATVLVRTQGSFFTLKDVEAGFDPDLIALCEKEQLIPVLRINQDAWTTVAQAREMMEEDLFPEGISLLFNSDDPPGGPEALPFWLAYFKHHPLILPMFEMHFSRSALQLAKGLPALAFRSHTIPSPELKDLTRLQELSRWRRSVEERSCRFLLIHTATNDSWTTFLDRLGQVSGEFSNTRWKLGFPRWRVFWKQPPAWRSALTALLATFLAILLPWISLRVSSEDLGNHQTSGSLKAIRIFLVMSLLTMAGACVMAVLAETPASRLEIVPFRGIKFAFLFGWLGSLFSLYGWKELSRSLEATIRRWDVLLALFVMALVGYAVIRSGNASAGWKPPLEQGLRDRLETLFIARPRFKEFAIGHPLLILGLYMRQEFMLKRFRWDGRPLMAIGMVGQVSLVNTFCHLHSPLRLIFLRSFNGVVLGAMIGAVLLVGLHQWRGSQTK